MLKEVKGLHSDHAIWFMVGAVFLCVLLVLIAVFNHDKEKPKSPQALVAAAFNNVNMYAVKEWKPGMGKRPFMYHPAGFNSPAWRPLPRRPASGSQWGSGARLTLPGSGGPFDNTALYPKVGQSLQPGLP